MIKATDGTERADAQLANPTVPLRGWSDRPAPVTGAAARELGRMLLDDTVSGAEVVKKARRGTAALGKSNTESPVLRFRAADEEKAQLLELAEAMHRNQSDLLREGLQLLLAHYREQAPESSAATPASPAPARGVTVELSEPELRVLNMLAQRGTAALTH